MMQLLPDRFGSLAVVIPDTPKFFCFLRLEFMGLQAVKLAAPWGYSQERAGLAFTASEPSTLRQKCENH